MKKAIVILLMCFSAGLSLYAAVPAAVNETFDTVDVRIPAVKGKVPVIFLAHNGGASKEDWGDFPEELAAGGYAVVNMGWTDFQGGADFRRDIQTVMDKYSRRIDFKRAAFIGGCHGCVKMLGIMDSKLPFKPKALVLLSMSEMTSPPAGHAPILGVYSTKDHLGANYVSIQKKVYSNIVTEPKKILVTDTTQHGNEFVTDPETRGHIRSEIETWLKKLL